MTASDRDSKSPLGHPAGRRFLEHLIDYAGVFPPANLPLEEAVRAYAALLRDPDAWMLGRFICPVRLLGRLTSMRRTLPSDMLLDVSAIMSSDGADVPVSFALQDELDRVDAFDGAPNGPQQVGAIELRVPPQIVGTPQKAAAHVAEVTAQVLSRQRGPLDIFFEASWGASHADVVRSLAGATTALNPDYGDRNGGRLALKIRCGGMDAADYPASRDIARFIHTCVDESAGFKATAGLHHPIRHFSPPANTFMHGFLNVFGAAILARHLALSEDVIASIIEDPDARNFTFTDHSFCWKSLCADTDAIADSRAGFALSYGSCSFDEPRDDLRALGLL